MIAPHTRESSVSLVNFVANPEKIVRCWIFRSIAVSTSSCANETRPLRHDKDKMSATRQSTDFSQAERNQCDFRNPKKAHQSRSKTNRTSNSGKNVLPRNCFKIFSFLLIDAIV